MLVVHYVYCCQEHPFASVIVSLGIFTRYSCGFTSGKPGTKEFKYCQKNLEPKKTVE